MTDEILKEVSKDERLRYLRESREYAQMEIDWGLQLAEKRGMEKGIEQGIEKGIERGIEQARKVNATGMKSKGIAWDIIREITGLSMETIEAL